MGTACGHSVGTLVLGLIMGLKRNWVKISMTAYSTAGEQTGVGLAPRNVPHDLLTSVRPWCSLEVVLLPPASPSPGCGLQDRHQQGPSLAE